MTRLELFDLLKAKALADLSENQQRWVNCEGRGKRNEEIDAQMAEIRAANRISDILNSLMNHNMTDDGETLSTPHQEAYERMYLFIFQAMGVEKLTLQDLQPRLEEHAGEDDHSE